MDEACNRLSATTYTLLVGLILSFDFLSHLSGDEAVYSAYNLTSYFLSHLSGDEESIK